jgi:hypothetical protein
LMLVSSLRNWKNINKYFGFGHFYHSGAIFNARSL